MGFLFNRGNNLPEGPIDVTNQSQLQLDIALNDLEKKWAGEKRDKRNAAISAEFRRAKQNITSVDARDKLGENIGVAVSRGMRQQPSFTAEQEMLGQMFGHGDKIWGTNQQPVSINNDLNSSRSDPWDETSSMFGSGPFRQRSGLF